MYEHMKDTTESSSLERIKEEENSTTAEFFKTYDIKII